MKASVLTQYYEKLNKNLNLSIVWALALLSQCVLALALMPINAHAQSQNEVQVMVLFDGTTGFLATDPTSPTATANGTEPQIHTPGEDGGPNNLVVRTHDQFAVRVDWNINEADATGVVLTTELPAFAEWTVDDTLGYSGCVVTTFTPAVTISGNTGAQSVVCELGDQPEGSNGTIRMTALLNESTDDTTFDVISTLTNAEGSVPVADGLDQLLTVSAIPIASFRKGTAAVAGDPSTGPITSGGEDGILFLYPLSLIDFSQGPNPIIGAGPIGNGQIDFFDHAYRLTDNVTLATQQQMDDAGFVGSYTLWSLRWCWRFSINTKCYLGLWCCHNPQRLSSCSYHCDGPGSQPSSCY